MSAGGFFDASHMPSSKHSVIRDIGRTTKDLSRKRNDFKIPIKAMSRITVDN